MWRYRLRSFFKTGLALLWASVVLLPVLAANCSPFPFATDKEFYLYSPSSQAEIQSELELYALPFVQGESACVTDSLSTVLEKYSATVLFEEKGEGYVSYYCYSPKLKHALILDGKIVNLHIVEYGEGLRIGTPIIFGGY